MKRVHTIICGSLVLLLLAGIGGGWAFGKFDFFAPLWLLALLALPLFALVAVKGLSGLPSHTNAVALFLRCLLFTLIALILADIQIVLRNDSLCVLYVLDHSASIPEDVAAKELSYVNATARTKGKADTAGIVVFGAGASVEVMPVRDLKVDRIYSAIGLDYTDIQSAIELATAAFPERTRKKIVLITDGNENKGDLMEGVKLAAGNQVAVDVLPVSYHYAKEVLVEKVYLPDKIKENETFDLRVHVGALQECPAELSVYRNGVCVSREGVRLKTGRNTYTLAMKIEEPGFYAFTARIAAAADTIRENNEASGYVYIQGASRVLLVAPTELEVKALAQACREEDIEADTVAPGELPESLGMLQNYDCIVLANVAADELSPDRMTMLQADVRDLGVGLVMIGGENSFGAGGYEGTPVEEALPVSMDIKQKKINPKGALVLVLHTCEFPDGNYWAKQITKKAIEMLNSQDEVGVLIYGRGEEWLIPLHPAEDKRAMYGKIDQSSPGDMPSFDPTLRLAYEGLSKSDAMVRHIVIVSDGDPASPQPQLIKDLAAAGITISTVAINPHSPRDVDVLRYLAFQTGGRYYLAEDPSVLPRIFVKEAKVVKRSLIFNKKFQPLLEAASEITKGISPEEVPPLMAYVAATPKPLAFVPMVSDNENRDPILAYWRHGLGKAVAFTSDATSNWGKHWIPWDKYRKFWGQTIRWASRKREESNLRMHTEMDGARGKLIIDAVDPRGKFINFLKLNGRIVGPDNKGAMLDIRQTAPGRYEADFAADSVGVSIVNVGYQNPQTGGQGFAATGVAVPYSPEYHTLESNLALLRRAAAASGGAILSGDPKTDRVFSSSLPPTRACQPIWDRLLMVALVLLFADIVVRRVIVTREDLRTALAAVAGALKRRARAGEQDRTMGALLRRKKMTFEKVAAPARASPEFKEKLDQTAARPGGRADLGELVETVGPAPAEKAGSKRPEAKTDVKPARPAAAGESYTDRLLAAKKRAQRKGDTE